MVTTNKTYWSYGYIKKINDAMNKKKSLRLSALTKAISKYINKHQNQM